MLLLLEAGIEVHNTAEALQYEKDSKTTFAKRCKDTTGVSKGVDASSVKEVKVSTPNLWALVVGINEYPHLKKLSGCVSDANAINEYLLDNLGVPKENITLLLNEKATRNEMIKALEAFETNQHINRGDPILFYFSGHGGSAIAPVGWPTANNHITFLCPQDFEGATCSSLDGQGLWDLTLSTLLDKIAVFKGNNITLIFDSCHSGGGARNDEDMLRARYVDLDPENYTIPPEVVEHAVDLKQCRTGEAHAADLDNYVLISGCKDTESSFETSSKPRRGQMTVALLNILSRISPNTITYLELVDRMGVIDGGKTPQSPQCEGTNSNQLVFGAGVSGRRIRHYPLRQLEPKTADANKPQVVAPDAQLRPPKSYYLAVGSVEGITRDVIFDVYEDITKTPFTRVVANRVHTFSTEVLVDAGYPALPTRLKESNLEFWARLVRVGKPEQLKVSIQSGSNVSSSLLGGLTTALEACAERGRVVVPVETSEDLLLEVDGQCVRFQLNLGDDYTILFPQSFQLNSVDAIKRVCFAAADWLTVFRLSHAPDKSDPPCVVHCYELGHKDVRFGDGTVRPEHDLCVNRLITVTEDMRYGLHLEAEGPSHRWVSVFFLDPEDLSIRPIFQSPYAHPTDGVERVNPTFSQDESNCIIGYGDSGWPALQFHLSPDQDKKLGFLKIIVTNQIAWFFDVPQDSPFNATGSLDAYKTATTPQATVAGSAVSVFEHGQPLLPTSSFLEETSIVPVVIKRKVATT